MIDALGISNTDMAAELRLTKGSISDILYGRVKQVSGPVLELLKIKFDVNPAWLLTGEGEMFLPGKQKEEPTPTDTINRNGTEYEIIEGNVDTYPQIDDMEKVYRTGWFQGLSRDRKFLVAAVPELSDDAARRFRHAVEFEIKAEEQQKKEIASSEPTIRQKGEAG